MDGFHLAQPELVRLGRRDRMGAPDTFDAAGYASLLTRLRGDEPTVYAPSSGARSRSRSRARSPSRATFRSWSPRATTCCCGRRHKPLLDECWYVDTDEELRVQRLIQRHIEFGKTPEYARGVGDAQRRAQRRRRRPRPRPRRRARQARSLDPRAVRTHVAHPGPQPRTFRTPAHLRCSRAPCSLRGCRGGPRLCARRRPQGVENGRPGARFDVRGEGL